MERAPRGVEVFRFEVFETGESDTYRVLVECSSGTYVRVLAADVGARLGGGAYLRALRRVSVGSFRDIEALALDDVAPDRVATTRRARSRSARSRRSPGARRRRWVTVAPSSVSRSVSSATARGRCSTSPEVSSPSAARSASSASSPSSCSSRVSAPASVPSRQRGDE